MNTLPDILSSLHWRSLRDWTIKTFSFSINKLNRTFSCFTIDFAAFYHCDWSCFWIAESCESSMASKGSDVVILSSIYAIRWSSCMRDCMLSCLRAIGKITCVLSTSRCVPKLNNFMLNCMLLRWKIVRYKNISIFTILMIIWRSIGDPIHSNQRLDVLFYLKESMLMLF